MEPRRAFHGDWLGAGTHTPGRAEAASKEGRRRELTCGTVAPNRRSGSARGCRRHCAGREGSRATATAVARRPSLGGTGRSVDVTESGRGVGDGRRPEQSTQRRGRMRWFGVESRIRRYAYAITASWSHPTSRDAARWGPLRSHGRGWGLLSCWLLQRSGAESARTAP